MTKATSKTYTSAIGRRKTSVARVRLTPGVKKGFEINNKTLDEYFATNELRAIVEYPGAVAGDIGSYAVSARITGGGIHSQAEALAHGIARAISLYHPEARPVLKKASMLTRDARMKERRKFGLKKARKAPQWSKR